jgi:hypothetical protein
VLPVPGASPRPRQDPSATEPQPLGEVIELPARAPEQQQLESSSEPPEQQQLTREDIASFDALVAPLEVASGRAARIDGRGRAACIAAWRDHPTGFERCVDDVLRRHARGLVRHPAGLLVRKVFELDHEREANPPARLAQAASPAPVDDPRDAGRVDLCERCRRPIVEEQPAGAFSCNGNCS